jgi:predicted amidophosphoribosyltransferase
LLPERLTLIDEISLGDHRYIHAQDRCFHFGECCAGDEQPFSAMSRLIIDYQCRPSILAANPPRRADKERAIAAVAAGLRAAISQQDAERYTWVPIPPSKPTDDPDFDDRLARTLLGAFIGYAVDVRAILRYAAPAAGQRAPESHNPLWVDVAALRMRPLRERIALFDDVLCTGRHYRWAEHRLREVAPAAVPISGIFLARRVLQDPTEPEQGQPG